MNVQFAESLVSLIVLVLAYFISVTFAGSFRAWVANMFGDDTGESLGLLSLNPLAHVDFFGGLFLLFFGFGWGKHVPVNPHRIYGRFRGLKIVAAYLSNSFAHLFMAAVVFFSLIYAFGFQVLGLAIPMIYTGQLLQSQFAHSYPEMSSIAISLGLIGIALVFLNTLLAVLNFIVSSFNMIAFVLIDSLSGFSKYRDVLMIAIPMIMIFFFVRPLRIFVIRLLLFLGWVLASWFGGL